MGAPGRPHRGLPGLGGVRGVAVAAAPFLRPLPDGRALRGRHRCAVTPRGASLFVGACLLLVALLLAVVPFSRPLPGINVALDCDPPVASAWSTGQRDHLALWVVTVG